MEHMSASQSPEGQISPGFEGVRDAFEYNFRNLGEIGAAFAAYHQGRCVVDLWGGASRDGGAPWQEDTLCPIWSGSKGLVATCILLLHDQGELEFDAPLRKYWPEFRDTPSQATTVAHVLSHTSGLPGISEHVSFEDILDPVKMANLLAAQDAFFPPGSVLCYHPLTYGWLCDALIRGIAGISTGDFFHDEIARPLGLEAWIGLPTSHKYRVAKLQVDSDWGKNAIQLKSPALGQVDSTMWKVYGNPPNALADANLWNRTNVYSAEIPGANGIATSRSVAKLYGYLTDGASRRASRLLSPSSLLHATRCIAEGDDVLTSQPLRYSTGFQVATYQQEFGPEPIAFGHRGAGGSVHGCWPRLDVGFSYVMNLMRDVEVDQRPLLLLRALHDAVTTLSGADAVTEH
jgi:CubicO group peptidase (beta-lactamase class C family)